MSTAADKCVNDILKEIKATFNGFDEDAVREFHKIMSNRVKLLVQTVKKEATGETTEAAAAPAPKVPKLARVTNYTMFGNHFRSTHKGDGPDKIEAKQMFSNISAAWGKLSETEKTEWKVKADAHNEVLKAAYIEKNGSLPTKATPSNSAVRTKPTTTNAFQQYVVDFRAANKDVNHKEVFGKAGEKWRKMTPKQKKPYEEKAEKLNAEYKAEWEKFVEENPEAIIPVDVTTSTTAADGTVTTVTTKGKKAKTPAAPRPRGRTGYIIWGDHWRSKLNPNKLTGKVAMTAIGESWKKLSEKEKAKYNEQSVKEQETAVQEFIKKNPDALWTKKHLAKSTSTTSTDTTPAATTVSA